MTDAPVDPSVLAELQDAAGAEFAAELLDTFLDEEGPAMIADLKAATDAADVDTYRRTAHSIKSNAQVFGATALANIARDMELKGLDTATEVGVLVAAFEEAATTLRGMLDG
ncbi:MAG: Hpt domain-containing protein [Pseudomonadota bacterium]